MDFAEYDFYDLVAFSFNFNPKQKEISIIYDCYYDNKAMTLIDLPCQFTIKNWECIYMRDINNINDVNKGYKLTDTVTPFDIIKEKDLNKDGDLLLSCIGKQWEELQYKFIKPTICFKTMKRENKILNAFPEYYNSTIDRRILIRSVKSGKGLLHQLATLSNHQQGKVVNWKSIYKSISNSWVGYRRVIIVHEDIHLLSDSDLMNYSKVISNLIRERKDFIFVFNEKDCRLIMK